MYKINLHPVAFPTCKLTCNPEHYYYTITLHVTITQDKKNGHHGAVQGMPHAIIWGCRHSSNSPCGRRPLFPQPGAGLLAPS